MLPRAFNLDGTAGRREAWVCTVLAVAMFIGVIALRPDIRATGFEPVAFALLGMTQVWMLATLVRRLHDTGRSGIWVVLCALPLIGLLAMLVILCLPSRPGRQGMAAWRRAVGGAVLLALLALFVLRGFFSPFAVNGTAMLPTLLVGDYFIIRHMGWQPHRGDVAVAATPKGDLVMRIIGMPGDRVAMQNGIPVLNGTPLDQTPAGNFTMPGVQAERLTETLPDGKSHDVLNIAPMSPLDTMPDTTVPEGHYFMLGDHRDNALDSRMSVSAGGPGMVSADSLLGHAEWIIVGGKDGAIDFRFWTSDRFFKRVE